MCLKNYLRKSFFFLLAANGLLLLQGCGGEKKTETTVSTVDTATTQAEAPVNTESAKILSALPKTSDVPAMIRLTGAEFNQALINPANKAASYTITNDKAALNLGLYGTDIGYLSVYNKTQDVVTYMKATQKLGEHLGLSNTFGDARVKRFQDNLSNQDSLIKIVDETMGYINQYLIENKRDATGALVVTGSFIEGLYISTGLIEKYPKDIPADTRNAVLTQLILKIMEQKKSLADLLSLLKSVSSDEAVTLYTQKLTDLYTQFEALKFEENLKANAGSFSVTDQSLLGITKQVKEIRNEIIKP